MSYFPNPTHAWSRVRHAYSYALSSNDPDNFVYVPLIHATIPSAQADYDNKMLYKGNILQYKSNCLNLTKKQKYAQICKGGGPCRKKTYAAQTQVYTNPNTNKLQSIGSVVLDTISGVPCPYDCSTNNIIVSGHLICGTYANPCTGEVYKQYNPAIQCFSSSCSDVPGNIKLCWNSKVPTWYPQTKTTMNNSANKWPQNYKGFVSAIKPLTPILNLIDNGINLNNTNSIVLVWSVNNNNLKTPNFCSNLQITQFNVYQNGVFYNSYSYLITSIIINNLNPNTTYSFYVTAISNGVASPPSNIVNYY